VNPRPAGHACRDPARTNSAGQSERKRSESRAPKDTGARRLQPAERHVSAFDSQSGCHHFQWWFRAHTGTTPVRAHPDSAPLEAVAPMKGCRGPVVPCSGFAPLRLRRQPSTPTIPVPGTSSPGSRDLRLRHAHLRPRRIHSARPGQSEQVAKQVASAQSLSGGCLRQPPLAVRPRSESSARRARVS